MGLLAVGAFVLFPGAFVRGAFVRGAFVRGAFVRGAFVRAPTNKHTQPDQYNSNDKEVYRSLVAQTRVKSLPNSTDGARPHTTRTWKYMLKKMVIPGERMTEEEEGSEDTDDTDTASIGDIL